MPAETTQALAKTFPESVYDSLAELRRIATVATGRDDERLRWATPEEIALAETLRKPYHCVATSTRTGLPCARPRVLGATTCPKHGASIGHVKEAAKRRLRAMVDPVLGKLYEVAMTSKHDPSVVKAAQDLLDRAGIGEVVEAKTRASEREGTQRITVHLGFIHNGTPSAPIEVTVPATPTPLTIDATAEDRDE